MWMAHAAAQVNEGSLKLVAWTSASTRVRCHQSGDSYFIAVFCSSSVHWKNLPELKLNDWLIDRLTDGQFVLCQDYQKATYKFYTVSQKVHPLYFSDYSVKCWPIIMIFGSVAADIICNQIIFPFLEYPVCVRIL